MVAPGWLHWFGVQPLISAQVMLGGWGDRAPHQALRWPWSLLKVLPLPLSPSPPHCTYPLLSLPKKK